MFSMSKGFILPPPLIPSSGVAEGLRLAMKNHRPMAWSRKFEGFPHFFTEMEIKQNSRRSNPIEFANNSALLVQRATLLLQTRV